MRESSRRTLTGFFVVGVALFATILTGYLLRRAGDPSAYAWAPTLLDPRVAIAEAVSLLVACFASVGALRWSRSGRPGGSGRACIPLVAVLAAGAIVLGVRAVALPSTLARAGLKLELPQAAPARANAAPAPAVVAAHLPNPTEGKRVYLGTCAACHAPDGSGVKGQGQNLRDSDFFKDKTDEKL